MFFRALAALTLAVAGLGLGLSTMATPAQTAVGGPVILGGDDLTAHGYVDGSGDLQAGWLYIQRALENIGPAVTRSNDGHIAALGSSFSENTSSDAGAAIGYAGDKVGRSVTYYEGPEAIDTFFANLASGATDPAIIWIAGNDASNDLDSFEETAITNSADAIADFVSEGGGLMSHGLYYGWLFALLPDAAAVDDGGGEDDLYFTADGLTDLPALTEGDINAGPWHNYFEGDLGGLKVLVRSSEVLDKDDNGAAVIIGGSQVTFVAQPDEPTSVATPCIQGISTSRCPKNPPVSLVTPAATATAVPPTAVPVTAVPPASVPTRPGGGAAGVISAPDTGTGPGGSGSGNSAMLMSLGLLAAGLVASSAAVGLRRR